VIEIRRSNGWKGAVRLKIDKKAHTSLTVWPGEVEILIGPRVEGEDVLVFLTEALEQLIGGAGGRENEPSRKGNHPQGSPRDSG